MTLEGGIAAETVWRLPPTVRFDRRQWGDEVVVFNYASGQTHLLDALSASVLATFEEAPRRLCDLAVRFAEDLEIDVAQMRTRLDAIVEEFARLGLLDPDPA